VELLELLLCNVYVLVELLYIWMYIWQDDDDDDVMSVSACDACDDVM
jgi:hypothetical protein